MYCYLSSGLGKAACLLVLVIAMVAGACGGGNGNNDAGTGTSAQATEVTSGAAGADSNGTPTGTGGIDTNQQANQDSNNPQNGSQDNSGASTTNPTTNSGTDTPTAEPKPQYGGTLVVGLEAETNSGLNPVTAQAAVSGHIVFRALYDTLTIEGADGQMLPNLLESFSSNEDFTEWTLTLPPQITFHDGTAANAAALKRHFEEQAKGTLTGVIIRDWDIQEIQIIDNLSIKLVLGGPYASLPAFLSSHLGYFGAPSMHNLSQQEASRNPIGTGPFMLTEWIPDEVTRVERNPNYWRTDAVGGQLPYLDAIEFRPIPDTDARFATLRSGALDASSVDTGLGVVDYNEQFKTFWQDEAYKETSYLLLNNSRPPFDDVEFRRALAQCTDTQTLNTLRWDGQAPATGPFSPGTPGYLADSGFSAYNPEEGRAAIARLGVTNVELGTTIDGANLLTADLLSTMWSDCGLDVSVSQVDQTALITTAVIGNFNAFFWRQHEGYDLAVERVWWHSKFGRGVALNFGRINNPAIDAALDEVLTTTNQDRRRELAEDINRAFGEQVHYLWAYHSNWLFVTQDNVYGVDNLTLRDGAEHAKVFSGRVFLTETWVEQ